MARMREMRDHQNGGWFMVDLRKTKPASRRFVTLKRHVIDGESIVFGAQNKYHKN